MEGVFANPFFNLSVMKIYRFLFLLILLPLSLFAQNNAVVINGWTNIGTFKCANDNFQNSRTIYSFSGNQLPNISLKVVDFDCRNKVMTADFRKTLNAQAYPKLTIRFLHFEKVRSNFFAATVEVKMMNVSRKYNIEFSEADGSLVGNKRLKFSDFNIVPPKKMGGMVYVKNEIDLFFSLALR